MNYPNLQDLSPYFRKVDIIRETALQIQKDFALYEEEIQFSGNTEEAYPELYDQIFPLIKRFLELDPNQFFSLLYSIDVDEKQIKSILFGESELDAAAEITRLIIEREVKKVIIRLHFKSMEVKNG